MISLKIKRIIFTTICRAGVHISNKLNWHATLGNRWASFKVLYCKSDRIISISWIKCYYARNWIYGHNRQANIVCTIASNCITIGIEYGYLKCLQARAAWAYLHVAVNCRVRRWVYFSRRVSFRQINCYIDIPIIRPVLSNYTTDPATLI